MSPVDALHAGMFNMVNEAVDLLGDEVHGWPEGSISCMPRAEAQSYRSKG